MSDERKILLAIKQPEVPNGPPVLILALTEAGWHFIYEGKKTHTLDLRALGFDLRALGFNLQMIIFGAKDYKSACETLNVSVKDTADLADLGIKPPVVN